MFRINTSVKRNPVWISDNMPMAPPPACFSKGPDFPGDLPFRTASAPSDVVLSTSTRNPYSTKSSKFCGSALILWICGRVILSALMV